MSTFNQLANRVANIINNPFNHELKERIKDAFRSVYATRVRQSIQQYGIDNILKTSYTIELSFVNNIDNILYPIIEENYNISDGKILLRSNDKILKPIRFINDAPFTFVGNEISIPYRSKSEIHSLIYSKYHTHLAYYTENDYIFVITTDPTRFPKLRFITVESIFESPEEVLGYYLNSDIDDITIPIPNDMLESIIQDILKTEFGLIKQNDLTVTQTELQPNK